jgi:hypothetical protein
LLLAGCAGADDDETAGPPPQPRQTGIEVVNASGRDVTIRWFPKTDEPAGGSALVPRCSERLIEIAAGHYSLAVSSPRGLVDLSWGVTADLRCCLSIARDGKVDATPARPPKPRC